MHFNLTHVENVTRTTLGALKAEHISMYVKHAQQEEVKFKEMSVVLDSNEN